MKIYDLFPKQAAQLQRILGNGRELLYRVLEAEKATMKPKAAKEVFPPEKSPKSENLKRPRKPREKNE